MKIKNIQFRNCGPYGNRLQQIDFSENGSLILLSGQNGVGKCLSKDTNLTVMIEDEYVREKFLEFLKHTRLFRESCINEIICTIEDLYKFNRSFDIKNFKVKTQFGFNQILKIDITARNSEKIYIKTERNKFLEASPDHLLYNGDWIKIKNLKVGDKIKTLDGYEEIVLLIPLTDKEDLYDLEVKDVHEFFANDIVSHNSTLINLPKILFYGKLDKFKKEDIANRINKHAWIRGEIETNPGSSIIIERKIAPSDLYIEKNSVNIDQAGLTNLQDYIDTEVTGLPYHIFSNIISLSIADFKSFITMTPSDKRIIIDKLFAMEIINKMNELVRKDLREIKTNIDLLDREILTLKTSLDNASLELTKLQSKVSEDNTKKIEKLKEILKKYKKQIDLANQKLIHFKSKESDIKKSYDVFNSQKSKLTHELNSINEKIELYNQDKCPTCETPFNDNHFELIKGNLHELYTNKQNELETLKSNEVKYKNAFAKVQEVIKKLNNFILENTSTYKSLYKELEKILQDKPKEFASIQNIISSGSIQIREKDKEKEQNDEDYKYLNLLSELYGDNGVKQKILDNYIPTLNKEIEYSLSELHFPYRMKFNSDFEANIDHLGIPINVDSLSTGEKKLADLAVLVAIVRMMKRKYPNLNIFMLDEVLSSLDTDKIYDVLGILQRTSKELNMNIFVVHHGQLPMEFFSTKIEITKIDGFSDLKIQNLEENN